MELGKLYEGIEDLPDRDRFGTYIHPEELEPGEEGYIYFQNDWVHSIYVDNEVEGRLALLNYVTVHFDESGNVAYHNGRQTQTPAAAHTATGYGLVKNTGNGLTITTPERIRARSLETFEFDRMIPAGTYPLAIKACDSLIKPPRTVAESKKTKKTEKTFREAIDNIQDLPDKDQFEDPIPLKDVESNTGDGYPDIVDVQAYNIYNGRLGLSIFGSALAYCSPEVKMRATMNWPGMIGVVKTSETSGYIHPLGKITIAAGFTLPPGRHDITITT